MGERLISGLLARARLVLVLSLLTAIPMTFFSVRLFGDVRADVKELLPQSAESVKTLAQLERRFGGWSQLSIIVTSPDQEANRRFSDDLVARLRTFEEVRSARNKLGPEREFFKARRHLFLELDDLEEIKERIEDAIHDAKVKANPLLVELEEKPETKLDFTDIEAKYEDKLDYARRFPNAYFESKDGKEIAIIVRQRGLAMGIERNRALVEKVELAARELDTAKYHPDLVMGLGGDVKNMIEEQTSLIEDLIVASIIVFFLLALVVVAYFRRFRTLLLIAVPLYVGCVWTFGLSHFLIGHLNASTAFLGPIVPGNGINFGLILLARYIEERRNGHTPEASLPVAIRFTAKATGLAALAASIAYGSLMATNFLGFKHFGVIGGLGMVLCWLATFAVLPPFILLAERYFPLDPAHERLRFLRPGSFARLVPRIVLFAPRAIAAFGLVTGIACAGVMMAFLEDPFEKDFNKLRSTISETQGAAYWEKKVDKIFGRYLAPQIILTNNHEDVPLVVAHLNKLIAASDDRRPITEVSALTSLVPPDQADKIEVLDDIRELLSGDLLDSLSKEQRAMALKHRPPVGLAPFTRVDLPESIRRDFRELDGREGLVVLAIPNLALNLYHADEIKRVAEWLRAIPVRDGRTVKSSGNFVIYDDMLTIVGTDGPRATMYSFFGVLLLCLLAYRKPDRVLCVSSALVVGVCWLGALLAVFKLKINFLNFIALPITFGIGVDYGVNIFSRYLIERDAGFVIEDAAPRALSSTGGAVVLCSLTTIIGYGSLIVARNGALISFGKVAILGEFTCLIAALFVMPAWLVVLGRFKSEQIAPHADAEKKS